MTKSELRARYKEKRSQLSIDQVNQKSASILENLKTLPIWEKSVFHVFVPIEKHKEVNTHLLMDFLFENGKRVVVPKVVDNQIISCEINENVDWEMGEFSVSEPKEYQVIDTSSLEVVFVPMLICDEKGNRIGYGGGYYDRFLVKTDSKCLKVGLNFFPPIAEISEIEETDIPIDYCVTSDEIVSFTS